MGILKDLKKKLENVKDWGSFNIFSINIDQIDFYYLKSKQNNLKREKKKRKKKPNIGMLLLFFNSRTCMGEECYA